MIAVSSGHIVHTLFVTTFPAGEVKPGKWANTALKMGVKSFVFNFAFHRLATPIFMAYGVAKRHERLLDQGVEGAGIGRALRIRLTMSIANRCAAAGPSIAVTFPVPRTMPVFGPIILKIQSYVRKGLVTSI